MRWVAPRQRRRRTVRALLLGLAAAGLQTTHAADSDEDAALRLAMQACQDHAGSEAPDVNLAAQTARLHGLQNQSRPRVENLVESLAVSCRTWRALQADPGRAASDRLEWLANIGGALLYVGRSAQAEALLQHAYQGFVAGGPAESGHSAPLASTLAFLARQRDDSAAALAWSERAIKALDAGAPGIAPVNRLTMRVNHGAHLTNARRFDEADAWLQGLWQELEPQLDTQAQMAAGVLNMLTINAQRQQKLGQALAYAQRELALRQTRLGEDPIRLANTWHSTGLLMNGLARYDDAAAAMETAVRIGEQAVVEGRAVDLTGVRVNWLNSLSALQLARGMPEAALATAQRASALAAQIPGAQSAFATRAWRQLAEAQLANGQLAAGLDSYRAAQDLLQRAKPGADAGTLQGTRLGLARALLELGDTAAAQAQLQPDGPLPRPAVTLPDELAEEQVLRAVLAHRRGDLPAALAALSAAEAALPAEWPANHPKRRTLAAQRCGLDASACAALAADTAEAASTTQTTPEADALVNLALARSALSQGQTQRADDAASRALAAALASGQPRLLWQAYMRQAEVAAQAARLPEAVLLGKLAITTLQQQRAALWPLGAAGDTLYMADKADAFRQVAHWLLQQGRVPEALEVMRLLKRHEQDEFLMRGVGEMSAMGGAAVPSLTPAEQQAVRQFQALAPVDAAQAQELQRLGRLAATGRITPDERSRLDQLQQQAAAQRREGQAGLRSALAQWQAAQPAARPGAATADAARSASALRPPAGSLHAWLLAGNSTLDLLLAGPRGVRHVPLALPSGRLAAQIAELHDSLPRQGGDTVALGRQLYQAFGRHLDEAARDQGALRIELWLDGPLRYLPLGLLNDGRQFLAERYALRVQAPAQRAQLVMHGAGAHANPPPSVAAFGVTRAWQGLPALPSVADEVCGIVAGPVLGVAGSLAACGGGAIGGGPLPGEGRLDAHFTESTLGQAAAAGQRSVLHIGTHFVLRPGNVASSWLLLGDGQRLALRRLRALPLAGAQLVTLSACETGVLGNSADADGREVDGLSAALLDGGAKQVLASLWRVDDRATATFMQRFYAHLVRLHGDAPRALQRTQSQAVKDGWPARHWAAFTLTVAAR